MGVVQKFKEIRYNGVILAAKVLVPKKYYCSMCGKKSAFFLDFGTDDELFNRFNVVGCGKRKKVLCLRCGAIDRFRWIDWCFKHKTSLYKKPHDILHIAPEKLIADKLKKVSKERYVTGDINPGRADCIVDVTKMQFDDASFDYVIMNQVLEHVASEKDALHEIHRVLRDGGVFIFSVPVCVDQDTYEAERILPPEERLHRYGQEDHFRLYGKDIKDHIGAYGFDVEELNVSGCLSKEQIIHFRVTPNDRIYIAKRH